MPRFPAFRRRSTVTEDQNGPIEPSFRVLDRSEVPAPAHNSNKSFDGGARMMGPRSMPRPKSNHVDLSMDDNLFVDTKNNRNVLPSCIGLLLALSSLLINISGSGSSNTTKTTSDNSSRHSNASTAPSSTDFAVQDDWRLSARKTMTVNDVPLPPPPKASGFLNKASRTFSFGTKKNSLPAIPADEPVPQVPHDMETSVQTPGRRVRAPTESSTSTATPPKVEDRDFMKDLGGDLSNMLSAFKRSSVVTVKDESGRPVLASRNLTGNRLSQSHPSPLQLDKSSAVDPPPHSWTSQHSNEGLLAGRALTSPTGGILPMPTSPPPIVPRSTASPMGRRHSDEVDEDAKLLSDTLAATRFLSNEVSSTGPSGSRGYRRDDDRLGDLPSKAEDENLFYGRTQQRAPRTVSRVQTAPQHNKVMTPEEFEQYRRDKVRQQRQDGEDKEDSDNEDAVNYDDDEDEREKTRQMAKQRLKQEAQMTVYRQQMMKVTGEQAGSAPAHQPGLSTSMSTPNLPGTIAHGNGLGNSGSNSPPSDGSDEDEEVPLAILAAHGFPNKNRPPTRLHHMASNPSMHNSMSQPPRPGSAAGDVSSGARGPLPAFARKLPQDPFLGAGLIHQRPRESFALGGGSPAPGQPIPSGGLVGVIAEEERQRAMRRGSPAVDHTKNALPPNLQMPVNSGFDAMGGMHSPMLHPMNMPQQMPQMPQMPMFTPGDQAQMQMNQQMQQFMQMQMQFMQMMAMQGQNPAQMAQMGQMGMQMPTPGARPLSHMPSQSMSSIPDMSRAPFLGDPVSMGMGMGGGSTLAPPRGDAQMRTMSMVQPSSASWIQPPQQGPGYAPSIRIQGVGYAPSIAPSERSNIGLPNRYRPVSSINMLDSASSRTQTMSGALPTLPALTKLRGETTVKPVAKEEDDDDEQGWEKMREKRDQKKSLWRTKKSIGADIGALIS